MLPSSDNEPRHFDLALVSFPQSKKIDFWYPDGGYETAPTNAILLGENKNVTTIPFCSINGESGRAFYALYSNTHPEYEKLLQTIYSSPFQQTIVDFCGYLDALDSSLQIIPTPQQKTAQKLYAGALTSAYVNDHGGSQGVDAEITKFIGDIINNNAVPAHQFTRFVQELWRKGVYAIDISENSPLVAMIKNRAYQAFNTTQTSSYSNRENDTALSCVMLVNNSQPTKFATAKFVRQGSNASSGFDQRFHMHLCDTIQIVTRGAGEIQCIVYDSDHNFNRIHVPLKSGTCILLPANTPHRVSCDEDGMDVTSIQSFYRNPSNINDYNIPVDDTMHAQYMGLTPTPLADDRYLEKYPAFLLPQMRAVAH